VVWEVEQIKVPATVNIRPLDSTTIKTDIRQHPNKHVTFRNNFNLGPSDWGWALKWLTVYNSYSI